MEEIVFFSRIFSKGGGLYVLFYGMRDSDKIMIWTEKTQFIVVVFSIV